MIVLANKVTGVELTRTCMWHFNMGVSEGHVLLQLLDCDSKSTTYYKKWRFTLTIPVLLQVAIRSGKPHLAICGGKSRVAIGGGDPQVAIRDGDLQVVINVTSRYPRYPSHDGRWQSYYWHYVTRSILLGHHYHYYL